MVVSLRRLRPVDDDISGAGDGEAEVDGTGYGVLVVVKEIVLDALGMFA